MLLLAAHYRRRGEGENVARIIRVYGDAIIRMEGSAAATVCAHVLQTLYGQLLHFRLRADADALDDLISVAGIASTVEMKPITVERAIPRAEVEKFVEGVLMGNAREVLVRITLEFLPRRAQLVPALRHMQESAVLLAMMPKSITDSFGRTVAAVGPASTDPEEKYIDHMSLRFNLNVPWLREIMRRGLMATRALLLTRRRPLRPRRDAAATTSSHIFCEPVLLIRATPAL